MINTHKWHATLSDAKQIPNEKNRLSSLIIEDNNMQIRYFSPKGKDVQKPHQQDEVYVVVKGSGILIRGIKAITFNAGDIIFVPKNTRSVLEYVTMDKRSSIDERLTVTLYLSGLKEDMRKLWDEGKIDELEDKFDEIILDL